MIHVPPELQRLILETDRLALAIRMLRAKPRLRDLDLRRLARLKADLLVVCPPERYAWIDGLPVVDILQTLHQQQTEREEGL